MFENKTKKSFKSFRFDLVIKYGHFKRFDYIIASQRSVERALYKQTHLLQAWRNTKIYNRKIKATWWLQNHSKTLHVYTVKPIHMLRKPYGTCYDVLRYVTRFFCLLIALTLVKTINCKSTGIIRAGDYHPIWSQFH